LEIAIIKGETILFLWLRGLRILNLRLEGNTVVLANTTLRTTYVREFGRLAFERSMSEFVGPILGWPEYAEGASRFLCLIRTYSLTGRLGAATPSKLVLPLSECLGTVVSQCRILQFRTTVNIAMGKCCHAVSP